MKYKFRYALSALALAAALTAHAQPPSNESLDALMTMTKVEASMESMYPMIESAMRQGMQQTLKGLKVSVEQQKAMDRLMTRMVGVMREELGWKTLRPVYLQVYAETLTQEEVDGLIAFYKTPAGVAMIEKMPVMMQKTMGLVQGRMGAYIQRMNAVMAEEMEKIKKAP